MSVVRSIDPRTGAVVEDVGGETTPADVAIVAESAATAFAALATVSYERRADMLDAMAVALEARRDELVAVADRETALGATRLGGELTRTCFQLRFFAGIVREGAFLDITIDHARDTAMGPAPDLRRFRRPLGPVAVFAASNFPFAFSVPGGDTASALAAGCPVVVKAHPSHPATSAAVYTELEMVVHEMELPGGTISLVHGVDAGRALVIDPHISAVAFTGSTNGGRALFDLATGRHDPIPFFGELGSLNPLVVLPGAASTRAADIGRDWVASFTLGVGQFCTKPGLALVPAGAAADDLHAAALDALMAVPPAPMLNRGMQSAFVADVEQTRELDGVTTSTVESGGSSTGFEVAPALHRVDASLLFDQRGLVEEHFGPAAILATYESVDELLAVVGALDGSLTATLHADNSDDAVAPAVAGALAARAGRLIWNGFPTGVAVSRSMQHGGPWPSATSPQHTSVGAAAIERFLRPVSYQNVPEAMLPAELRESNPVGLPRRVD